MMQHVIQNVSAKLKTSEATPAYLQVAQLLEQLIHEGTFAEGSALPAERDLSQWLGVSRVTVRQALAVLEEKDKLSRKRGSGTYVSGQRIRQSLSALTGFSDDMRARGLTPGAKVLSFERTRPSPTEAMNLALSPSAEVFRIRRLRTANGLAVAIECSTLIADLLPNFTPQDTENCSLYVYLGLQGYPPSRALQHLRARNADTETAQLLGIAKNTAILATERVTWDDKGTVLEYAHSVYRGDMYDFIVELKTKI